MTKRIAKQLDSFRYKGESVKITLGTLTLVALSVFIIIISTFTQISFVHYILPNELFLHFGHDLNTDEFRNNIVFNYEYIPQVPIIFFLAGFLGRTFGILAVMIYIALGLFCYPVFALGGGVKYILEYGFGYILAYIPAIFFAGSIVKSKYTLLNILKGVFIGVLLIHFIGVLYVLLVAIIKQETSSMITGWLSAQSGVKMLYDMFFSVVAMYVAKYLKKVLWITMC